jgi:hypothetical protein
VCVLPKRAAYTVSAQATARERRPAREPGTVWCIRYDQRLGLSGEFRDRSFYNRPYSYMQFSVKVRALTLRYRASSPRLDSYFLPEVDS